MRAEYPFLFNFAASYSGGGYKRLHEYARWFDSHGGASFAIHPNCEHLRGLFPGNRYFTVTISHLRRLFDDSSYLEEIARSNGRPELYYAYGIPLYRHFGRINWFHLQNLLSLGRHTVPLSLFHRLKFRMLGNRFRRGFGFADVISAESHNSLELLDLGTDERKFLATNGNDDELALLAAGIRPLPEELATAVGTFSYKGLGDAFRIFQTARERHPELKFTVIGEPRAIAPWLRRQPEVLIRGTLDRPAVMDILRRSRFYISATHVENSYNGAAEGTFLAQESVISDIPAHRELLQNEPHELIRIPGLDRPFFQVQREQLTGVNLKSWHTLISEMIRRVGYDVSPDSGIGELARDAANEPIPRDDPPRQQQQG